MKKIYNSRAFWGVISILGSVVMWIYVTSMEVDEFTHTFHNVPLELVGESSLRDAKNLVITDLDTSTVTVVVSGPRRVIAAWDSADLVARVDVSKLSRASYTSQQYYLVYPDGTDTSSVRCTRKSPESVNFLVSPVNSKTVQVRGSFDGSVAEGFHADPPVFEPATITVNGPEAYLKDVSYAWVSFGQGQESVSSTYKTETGYLLMNENGEQCSTVGMTFSDDVITASLPLKMVKTIPLTVDLIEGAGATKANTKVTIEPESIKLVGDSAVLDGINKLVLGTIDLTDFPATFSDTFYIPIDNNVKNLTGKTEAKVTVQIEGLETRTYKVSNFSCTNVTEGFEAVILTESFEVAVRGTTQQLDTLKSETIRAVADLTDYNESVGTFSIPVKIFIDGFTDVGAVEDREISVEIRKKLPAEAPPAPPENVENVGTTGSAENESTTENAASSGAAL